MRRKFIFQLKRFGRNSPPCCIAVKYLVLVSLIIGTVLTINYKVYYRTHSQNLYQTRQFMLQKRSVRPSFFDVASGNNSLNHIKIDWHDNDFIEYEKQRTGIGEQGAIAIVDNIDEMQEKESSLVNGYNGFLSDSISVNRSLLDVRHSECSLKKYSTNLPKASVIIAFYNEHLTTLLRTIHSIVNRTPVSLLLEVILINDYSSKAFLAIDLDKYTVDNFQSTKFKLIHLNQRSGLLASRMAGANAAQGDILVFIDAHTEANVNWLPPLLEPIAKNYRTCTTPFIDRIDDQNFEYTVMDDGQRGIFNWKLEYFRVPQLQNYKNFSEPFKTPVMNGGLFAMSAKFFWELNGYDDGLETKGGGQFELSFKIWQCGGAILDVPCSHFGHIFKTLTPYQNSPYYDITRNYKRVIEVWMDEYKEQVYRRDSLRYANTDAGDLKQQRALRDKLQCKSFKWYMQEVAFDVLTEFPLVDPEDFAHGTIKSLSQPDLCVDTLNDHEQSIGLQPCATNASQNFKLSYYHDISNGSDYCWDTQKRRHGAVTTMVRCHQRQGNQFWKYDAMQKMIMKDHLQIFCLDCDPMSKKIFLNFCDITNINQKFEWTFVNLTNIRDWGMYGARLMTYDY